MRVKATALATLIVLFLPTVASAELNLYQPIDITLTSGKSYNNPYRDIDLNATITPPAGSGEAGYTLPGFWDGGATFKIRFAPRRPGTYTVITSCSDTSDSGLHNKTFSYTVGSTFNPATPHGFVDRDPTNPYYFRYDDGTPFVWLGDTGWVALYDWGWSTTSMSMSNTEWQAIVDNRKQYGFTVLQVLAYNETVHWNDGQWPYSGNDGRDDNATINPVSWQRMESRAVYALNKGLMLYFMMSSSGTHYCFTAEQRRRLYRYVVARFAAYNVGFGSGEEVNDSSYGCWNDSLSQEMENDMASLQPYRKMFGLHGLPEFELGMGYTDILLFQKTDGGYFGKGQVGRQYGKPYVLGETLYYRPAGGHGTDDPVTIRQSAWETLLGGAAGYTFGQHEHCCAGLAKTELTDEGAEEMRKASAYFLQPGLDITKFTRFADLGSGHLLAGTPGTQFLILAENGGSFSADLSGGGGQLRGTWYDIANDRNHGNVMLNAGTSVMLHPPGSWHVLRLDAASSSPPPPAPPARFNPS